MGRQKKIKTVQEEIKTEVTMSDEAVLDNVQTEIDLARKELESVKLEIEEKKTQIKANANREISDQEMKLVEKQLYQTGDRENLKAKIERQRKIDSEIVTGKFMNRRAPGQAEKLCYIKYDTDPVKWYTLEDGKIYDIPKGFSDQLNGGTDEDPCYYTPHFTQKPGEMDPNRPESAIHAIDTSNKKYAFVPVRF